MDQLALAAYIAEAVSCILCMGVFAFLSFSYRSKMLKAYLAYGLVATAQAALSLTRQAVLMTAGGTISPAASAWVDLPTLYILAGYMYTGPRFYLEFAEAEPARGMRRLFDSLAVATMVLAPLSLVPSQDPWLRFGPSLVALVGFLASVVYGQAVVIRSYERLRDRLYRIGVPALVAYNVALFVGNSVDSMVADAQLAAGSAPIGILFEPLCVMAWNALSFVWAIKAHGSGFFAGKAGSRLDLGKARLYRLSERELELARLVARGEANKEIAAALGISANTARNHLSSIFLKTGARNRVELVRKLWTE